VSPTTPSESRGRTVHNTDDRGHVRDWLVGPAWSTPCDDLAAVLDPQGDPWGSDGRWVLTNGPDVAPLKAKLYRRHPPHTDQPLPTVVEGGPMSWFHSAGGPQGSGHWRRQHTGIDGLVDWSRFCFTPQYRYAMAATVLEVDQAEYRQLEVASTGPVAVFVGGDLVLQTEEFGYMEPVRTQVRVRLASGTTPVHVVSWQVAFRECRHVVGLRVLGPAVRVIVPSPDADEWAARGAEQVLDSIAVGPWASTDGRARLRGPKGTRLLVSVAGGPERPVLLSDGSATVELGDEPDDVEGAASMLNTGESELVLRVDRPQAPVSRVARVATLPDRHREWSGADDPATWRRELLEHTLTAGPGAARALARQVLTPGAPVPSADLQTPLRMLGHRYDCADFEAVGLVHLWRRLPLEVWSPGDRERVRQALLGFKFWIDQPGLDAMCYFTENHQFVWHTAELLVGTLFAQETFGNTGWTGRQHAEHARPLAVEWMRRKIEGGFSEFDSNAYLAIDAFALVSLVEFADVPDVRGMAEALLDKVLLTLASNSWRGVHAAAHGRSYTHTLRSGRFEETAPIMWLLWGTGALNEAVLPATALASAETYALPPVIRSIARHPPAEWHGRQVYRGDYRLHHDLLSRPYGSDLHVYRTPDAMLSSVQDYRAGLPGLQEHIWGATIGSEIQVFATHPAAATIGPAARPNAWAGQRILPRVHQHRDTVLVVHRIPDDDWMGTTHVWMPVELCDEWRQSGSWLAARSGAGYVAVATAGGLRPQLTGDEAMQCWWPVQNGWSYVATIGRAATDGSFDDFVTALAEPEFGGTRAEPAVRWTARDGRVLNLGWAGAFTVDDTVPGTRPDGSVSETLHLDNPATKQAFGAETLEVQWMGERLVLDYRGGRRIHPTGIGTPPNGAENT
jgi:hypothetical protein